MWEPRFLRAYSWCGVRGPALAPPSIVQSRIAALGAAGLFLLAGCSAPIEGEDLDVSGSAQVGSRALPSFEAMWAAYPHGDADEIKASIGGKVNASWITNTCTIRVSHALNEAGFMIPQGPASGVSGLHTVTGANGNQYAYRVKEFDAWLRANVGAPSLTVKATGGTGVDRAQFKGRRGIIMFEVAFSDATGHFDLWNSFAPAHDEYFARARTVSLWDAPTSTPLPEEPTDDAPAPTEPSESSEASPSPSSEPTVPARDSFEDNIEP